MARSDDFFLSPTDTGDDREFRADKRTGSTVQPIIDGVATFQAMERAIAKATNTVHLSLWIFNPGTPLQARAEVNRTLAGRKAKHRAGTWGELLAIVAGLGVQVRILLNDFDAVLADLNHANNWRACQKLNALDARWGKGNLQTVVSMHDARSSLGGSVLASRAAAMLTRLNKGGWGAARTRVAGMPGLWPYLTVAPSGDRWALRTSPDWQLHPAAHHQKLCVVDRTTGFCGGLDVNTGRLATPSHLGRLWHDIQVKVDGAAAADLDRNFLGRWNTEAPLFNTVVGTAGPGGLAKPARPVAAVVPVPGSAVPPGPGPATAQLWRTLSTDSTFSPVPSVLRSDIRDGYRKAIGQANQYVYIENQYVRSPELADWLIARRSAKPQLKLIMVLPVAPEEVAGTIDPVTDHGLFLQHQVLAELRTAFGADLGLYSMVARSAAAGKHATNSAGSAQIYVHSKAMLVDDEWATVGSANTNPRSFQVDTEANIAWYDPAGVRAFRLTLWSELLGTSVKTLAGWTPADFVSRWQTIAAANSAKTGATAGTRQGFIVPHDPARFPGHEQSQIPDAFVEAFNPTDPEPEYVV
ncbi:phosphatidylserine/phosphatidylglycerophosphate/cardiolipin synthase-like enzyme [Streptomyces sp. PvP037]|uniref:phospholipase D-like domain-containing protein n=1 Tax=Streptomyces sp. PvP037 TaxID=3156437 RepID=UPI0033996EAD